MTKTRDKADKAVGHLRFEKSAGRYRVFGTVNLGHNFQNRDEEVEYGTVQRHRGSPRWLFQCSRTQQGGFHYKTRWEAARALYLEYLTDPEILPKGNDGGTQDRILRAARAVARKYGEESHIAQFHMHDHRGDWLPSRTAFKYEDDLMVIYAGARHGGLEIVRKKTPDSTIGNPVCMVTPQGVCFRTHGEQIHLVKHIGDLLWERVTPGAK